MGIDIVPQQMQALLLLSVRVLAILSFTPVVSSQHAPFFVRVALAVLTAFAVQPLLKEAVYIPQTLGQYVVILAGEALIGSIIGFFIYMGFSLLSLFSEFFSIQMGLVAAQVLDPMSEETIDVVGQFASVIVTLVFISSHSLQKVFYYGVAQSFMALNSQDLFLHGGGTGSFLSFVFFGFAKLFERTFIIALPIFAALLLVNIGIGLYGKIAPQMNLLMLGIPLQVGGGLLLMLFLLPNLVNGMETFLDSMFGYIGSFLREARR